MNMNDVIQNLLADPQVGAYFLELLKSPHSDEEKVQKLREYLAGLFSQPVVAQPQPRQFTVPALQTDDRDGLLKNVDAAIRRAVRRAARSQHRDGGWGPFVERSNLEQTATVVLFLNGARELFGASVGREVEDLIRLGMQYLDYHPEQWAVEAIPTTASMPIEDISLMVRCFYRAGRAHLRRESAARIYRGIDRIYRSQNEDGGWDGRVWGYEFPQQTRIWSEVGGTSAALQAMAQTYNDRFKAVMEKGMRWLARAQNLDGSWSDGCSTPSLAAYQLEGLPSLRRTCDAVMGLLSAQAMDIPIQPYQGNIDRAVGWLCQQVTPILTRQDPRTGLGRGYTATDYEHVCLVLETLNHLPGSEHPLAAPCAAWLVNGQRRQEDDPLDGSWVIGPSARIALALAAFSRCAKEGSPPPRMPWVL